MAQLAEESCCTGCSACSAICPTDAIEMVQSEKDGFFRPVIVGASCVECGKCEAVCPERNGQKAMGYYSKVYAAIHRNEKIRNASASGGLFAALAGRVIERGGCVAGAMYDEGLDVVHRVAESQEALQPLLGSKYVQSDMRSVYSDIYRKLLLGKQVLFCGTPCQVVGVRRFAEQKELEDRLITVDLLCRGVPSPKAFHKYLENVEKKSGKKVIGIKFKDNEKGWHNVNMKIVMEEGTECYLQAKQSAYGSGFLGDNMIVRESCFTCPYKRMQRLGDITIGDFWGLRNTKLNDDKGTSVVIVNSEKGIELWDEVEKELEYKESTMWRVVKGNKWAFSKLPDNPAREQFWMGLGRYDFEEALYKARQSLK